MEDDKFSVNAELLVSDESCLVCRSRCWSAPPLCLTLGKRSAVARHADISACLLYQACRKEGHIGSFLQHEHTTISIPLLGLYFSMGFLTFAFYYHHPKSDYLEEMKLVFLKEGVHFIFLKCFHKCILDFIGS